MPCFVFSTTVGFYSVRRNLLTPWKCSRRKTPSSPGLVRSVSNAVVAERPVNSVDSFAPSPNWSVNQARSPSGCVGCCDDLNQDRVLK